MSNAEHHPDIGNLSCSFQDAVAFAAAGLKGTRAFAFISTRTRFEVGSLEGGRIMVMRSDDKDVFAPAAFADFDAAYELRLFGKGGDWHWRREGMSGNLVIRMPAGGEEIEQKYLMWGKAQPSVNYGGSEWTLMRDPRIKPFWAPTAANSGANVYLKAVEHVGRGTDGNAYIAFERLTGIEAGSDADGQ